MKKFMVLGAAMCIAMAFTGCKSSESAYKKAYEESKVSGADFIPIMTIALRSRMLLLLLLSRHRHKLNP